MIPEEGLFLTESGLKWEELEGMMFGSYSLPPREVLSPRVILSLIF